MLLDASSSNRLPSGAGRSSDWVFPDPMQVFITSTAPTVARNRLNGSTVALTIGGFGGGAVNLGVSSYNTGLGPTLGAPVYQVGGDGAGAGQIVRYGAGPGAWVNIVKAKTGYGSAASNPYACTMVSAIYALVRVTPISTINCGLECTVNGGPIGTNQGIAFIPTNTNEISVATCQTTPTVVRTPVTSTAAGFDETKLNMYGFFFCSATKDAEAFVQPYINGLPAGAAYSWGAGTVLPTAITVMTAALPQIYVAQNASLYLRAVAGFNVVSGPTLLDVL